MPEHLRALIVILILAGLVFMLARRSCSALAGRQTCDHWRNLWLVLTLIAFLAHNFWLYVLAAALILSIAAKRESNLAARFFLLLFLIPAASVQIPGFGIINYLFSIDHILLLELVILLPALIHLQGRGDTLRFGRMAADKILAAYLLLMAVLQFRDATITGLMRDVFYLFVNVFLPYFVISRSVKTIQDFRGALTAFVLAALVLAAIGIFEGIKHWLLYKSLLGALDLHWGYSGYLGRADMLRAQGTAGHAIALGYVMVVGLGLMLYLKEIMPEKLAGRAGLALIAGGLASSLSRGPWVGAALMIFVFTATGPNALRRLFLLSLSVLLISGVLIVLPGGDKIIDLLPWIGSVEKGGIEYRERIFDGALITIMRNPLFGAVDFTKYPEMQSLIQGEGIIDIVNTYLLIALKYGLVVMGLFIGFFALIVWGIFKQIRRLPDDDRESRLIGRALLASLIGILATLSTVSNITVIPVVYWSFAGLGVAYVRMLRESGLGSGKTPSQLPLPIKNEAAKA